MNRLVWLLPTAMLAAVLGAASPAMSQDVVSSALKPVTQAGADDLRENLARYLGQAALHNGFITVSPATKDYAITFKAAGELPIAPALGATQAASRVAFDIKPYTLHVAEREDGNWLVTGTDPMAFGVTFDAEGQSTTMTYDVAAYQFSGVYSPELATFLSANGSVPSMTMKQTGPQGTTSVEVGQQTIDMMSTDAGDGASDLDYNVAVENFVERLDLTLDPADPATRTPVEVKAARTDVVAKGDAIESRHMLELYAVAVSMLGGAKPADRQAELKSLLTASMPLWQRLDGAYRFENVDVTTVAGTFKLRSADVSFVGDGIETDGDYIYGFGFKGLETDAPAMPAWAKALIPRDAHFGFSLNGVDLATPAKLAIDDLDFNRDEPISPETAQAIAATFENKPPRFVIEPSSIEGADYKASFSGHVDMSSAGPETVVDIATTGIEVLEKSLQEAGAVDPQAYQALGFVSMAKGMAKPEADGSLVWHVVAKADGSLLLNGTMLKGPTPPDTEDPFNVDPPTDDSPGDDVDPISFERQ